MDEERFFQKPWWNYLEEDLKELFLESFFLIKVVGQWRKNLPHERSEFHDYAFVVFPAAKAYEGFLKKLFLDLGFISLEEYKGRRFRVGKALNPELDREKYANISIYDKLVSFCGGEGVARKLWDTWTRCRNLAFHWFPGEKNVLTFEEARSCITMIIEAVDNAFEGCKISQRPQNG